jgi:DNA-binding transcriptional MerR regulator
MRGIGEMSRESGLSVSALRFYDGAGLLVPAAVDPWSGYRRYSDDQVVTARLLARLRRVGMPLPQVRRLLEHRDDAALVDRLLRTHLTRLEQGLADARRELSAARALLTLESPMTRLTTTAEALRAALRTVRYAVGTDPELPMLTGVLLDAEDGAVRLAATDRYRLAVASLDAAVQGPAASVLLPVGLVDEVLAGTTTGPVSVELDGPDVVVGTVRGRRLDAEFPDYRRVLPAGAGQRLDVDADDLRAQLDAAPTRTVPTGPDGAEETATVLTFGDVEMGVNRAFLLEALDAGDAGQLVLELDGPLSPLAIRDPRRPGDVSLLMPIRLTA